MIKSTDWILTSKRLPKNQDSVLVIHLGFIDIAWYGGGEWHFRDKREGETTDIAEGITAWMPLPQPPIDMKEIESVVETWEDIETALERWGKILPKKEKDEEVERMVERFRKELKEREKGPHDCPFCGGEPQIVYSTVGDKRMEIECKRCHCRIIGYQRKRPHVNDIANAYYNEDYDALRDLLKEKWNSRGL